MPIDDYPAELDGPEAHRLADMAGMRDDLEALAEMAHRGYTGDQSFPNQIMLEALQEAALVRYGRVFDKDGKRDAFKVPDDWIPDEYRQAHEDFLSLRKRHVAHSVNDWEINTTVARLRVDRATGAGEVHAVSVQQSRVTLMSVQSLQHLEHLALLIAKRIREEMKIQEAKVLEIAKQIPIAELKRRIVEDPPDWPGEGPVGRARRRRT